MMKTITRSQGFSFVELVIVLGLVSAIMGVAISSLMEGQKGSAVGREEAEMRTIRLLTSGMNRLQIAALCAGAVTSHVSHEGESP